MAPEQSPSRWLTGAAWISGIVTAAAAALFLLGMAVAVGVDSSLGVGARVFGAAVFGVLGVPFLLFLLYAGYHGYRHFRPGERGDRGEGVTLELELENPRITPGEELRGHVRATSGGHARSISVTLALSERTDASRHAAVTVKSGPIHAGPVEEGTVLPFALRLPPDAPPGHRSTHGQLVWVVNALCDQPGHDADVLRELEVVPHEALDRRTGGGRHGA